MTRHKQRTTAVPEGWEPFSAPDTFIDFVGPFHRKRESEGMRLGLRVEQRHCNRQPFCHGGMLSALCDMLISFTALRATKAPGGLTVTMTVDFLGTVWRDSWLEGLAVPRKIGNQLVFVDCTLYSDGKEAVRANGIWKARRVEAKAESA